MTKPSEPEYIVDSKGRKKKVVLSIEQYQTLLENLHDVTLAHERRSEERVPWEEVKAELKRDGVL